MEIQWEHLDDTDRVYPSKVIRDGLKKYHFLNLTESEWVDLRKKAFLDSKTHGKRLLTFKEFYLLFCAGIRLSELTQSHRNKARAFRELTKGEIRSFAKASLRTDQGKKIIEQFRKSDHNDGLMSSDEVIRSLEFDLGVEISETFLRNLGKVHKSCPRFYRSDRYTMEQYRYLKNFVVRSRYYAKARKIPHENWMNVNFSVTSPCT